MRQYLGIDIGASSFKYGVGNSKEGLQIFSSVRITQKSRAAFEEIMAGILGKTAEYAVAGIGIGSPGTLSYPEGRLIGNNPNLPFFKDMSPADLLPPTLNLPVCVDNDANLMALAESTFQGYASCIGITVGSGIGCGIVEAGRVYHGAHGFAAELGHCNMVKDGALCTCGQRGCLEAYSSVDGIRRRLIALDSLYADLSLPKLIDYQREDRDLARIISEGEDMLIRAMANMATVMDPEALILGGGAMDLALYNIERIARDLPKLIPAAHRTGLKCHLAGFGNRAGVMGAIILCERNEL